MTDKATQGPPDAPVAGVCVTSPAARVALLAMIGVGFLPSLIRHSHGQVGKRSLHISQKSQFLVTCRRPPVAPRLCLNSGSTSSNFQEITRKSSLPRDVLQRTHRGCCMMPSPLPCFFPGCGRNIASAYLRVQIGAELGRPPAARPQKTRQTAF